MTLNLTSVDAFHWLNFTAAREGTQSFQQAEVPSVAACAQEADVVNSLNYSISSLRRKPKPCTQLMSSFRELSVIWVSAKVHFGKERRFWPLYFCLFLQDFCSGGRYPNPRTKDRSVNPKEKRRLIRKERMPGGMTLGVRGVTQQTAGSLKQ